MFDAFSADELTAIRLSLKVAAVAALASLPLGVLVGWLLARTRFPGKALLDALVHLPLVPLAIALSAEQHFLVFWASYLILSYALALVIHFSVERPFLMLKDSLGQPRGSLLPAERSGALTS